LDEVAGWAAQIVGQVVAQHGEPSHSFFKKNLDFIFILNLNTNSNKKFRENPL
jgi:hypothetical protein